MKQVLHIDDWRRVSASIVLTPEDLNRSPAEAMDDFFAAIQARYAREAEAFEQAGKDYVRYLFGPYRITPRVWRGARRKFRRKLS